ncbi:VOC family protein [Hymenobacter negativus]|uniref:VOC family protein n=1 Tax=Hymenobacter negativus TaxID=2795026 RepID=A0ABS3QM26_9BACT|nr:VOC family protein [Hymenobacter negativus]MBO2012141.1 VOC family protein [Hymenobacter negativus]
MKPQVLGLHHVTALAGPAQRNYNFYAKLLGVRFIKKTVNAEAPDTYLFYFGDEAGSPGTVLSFLSHPHRAHGRPGTGQASMLSYSVPSGSFPFWMERFEEYLVPYHSIGDQFGEPGLAFSDPDGLSLALIVSNRLDERPPWTLSGIGPTVALRGLHTVQLTLPRIDDTLDLLTELLGYRILQQQRGHYRLVADAVSQAALLDIVEDPHGSPGRIGGGSVHHIAFRVANEEVLRHFRERLVARNLLVTPDADRRYFHSVRFTEPGGLLFELATDAPGFTVDEPLASLGTHLQLPAELEHRRTQITALLPTLTTT